MSDISKEMSVVFFLLQKGSGGNCVSRMGFMLDGKSRQQVLRKKHKAIRTTDCECQWTQWPTPLLYSFLWILVGGAVGLHRNTMTISTHAFSLSSLSTVSSCASAHPLSKLKKKKEEREEGEGESETTSSPVHVIYSEFKKSVGSQVICLLQIYGTLMSVIFFQELMWLWHLQAGSWDSAFSCHITKNL